MKILNIKEWLAQKKPAPQFKFLNKYLVERYDGLHFGLGVAPIPEDTGISHIVIHEFHKDLIHVTLTIYGKPLSTLPLMKQKIVEIFELDDSLAVNSLEYALSNFK